ncbi:Type IV conjugative transfer system coupling protein TraD [Vibrio nigripulchritudo SFn27]|nr:Type IV conjugative transfer system coupling protein TraD [Vibrio nigripulchritudo AM115]CCN44974.1 Type IV conjugative transfer system coupling protein TraD [Vibrio nigripulchritudo FTn2]CCN79732.1 Type IV conjugative transfer system coupling protein TraD [Vibrio nigripulchritudo SO65]CCN91954.1 Type IV conjugative transfer system coupling protein TraD [Vibrio nigripulchritudo SFn27]CCO43988.1 Type IV conjugative transfer system coupling protein TraD [Vibrio nigripulchritudo SFn135]
MYRAWGLIDARGKECPMSTPLRDKSGHMTRGGQITFHALRMFFQVNQALIRIVSWGVGIATLLLTLYRAPSSAWQAEFYYWRNILYADFGKSLDSRVSTLWQGERYSDTLGAQLTNPTLLALHDTLWFQIQVHFLLSLLTGFIVFALALRFFRQRGQAQSLDVHIRGFQLAPPHEVTQSLKARAKRNRRRGYEDGRLSDFRIDGLALLKQHFEVQHLGLIGTTGAGKSVMIRKLVAWIRQRGDKAIIYDKGCTFVSKFYDPSTDTILNPFDVRCANWTLWSDASDAPDFENMAAALIPQHGEGDPFWVDSARTIFASTAFQMMRDQKPCTNVRLLNLLLTSELEMLGSFLKGTESASLVSNDIKKTAISIKSVLATYIKSLRFLDGLEHSSRPKSLTKPFSITQWIHDEQQKGFLFLSSNARQHASLRPLISMWLAIASNAILGLDENSDRRIWVIMDEMPSLHKLPELGAIIAEVRKFGGCYLIGIQSYAQLLKTYGRNAADEMFDLLNSRFFFRAPSAQMAEISSRDLGEQEVDLSKENVSYGANTLRDGVSLGHQTVTRRVVSPSEIQGLDDLECYLRTPGSEYITKLDLHYDRMANVAPAFDKRDWTLSAGMKKAYEESVYYECVAPGLHLSEADRKALLRAQEARYEDEMEMRTETKSMQRAMKSDTVSDLIARDTQEKHYQESSQRELDEAAITDLGEFAD